MKVNFSYGVGVVLALAAAALPRTAEASEPRTHDGFFFQASLGFGPGWVDEELSGGGTDTDVSFSGVTGMFELLFGGTPARGLVVGGALTGHSIVNPTVEMSGQEFETDDTSVGISQLSLFTNYYFQPQAGFYVHGSLGFATASVTVDGDTYDTDATGVVLGVGAGYDFWIANEWSIGPQLRLTYARLGDEEDGVEAKSNFLSPILALTVTYH